MQRRTTPARARARTHTNTTLNRTYSRHGGPGTRYLLNLLETNLGIGHLQLGASLKRLDERGKDAVYQKQWLHFWG